MLSFGVDLLPVALGTHAKSIPLSPAFSAGSGPIRSDEGIFDRKLVASNTVRLRFFLAIALRMAKRAQRDHIIVVLRVISVVVGILMTTLTFAPLMSAIGARQIIDALARLLSISGAWRLR
jgi:hypothetical protein